jgi:hypothetical protein
MHSVPKITDAGVRWSETLSSAIHCSTPVVAGYTDKAAFAHSCVVKVR